MEKDHDPRRKKSRQHPGKKHPKRDHNQPPLTQFFPRLKHNKLSMNLALNTPKIKSPSCKSSYVVFSPTKKMIVNTQILICTSLQTCDSKPLIPRPRPPKPSELCQGSALVSVRDDAYWESLDRRLMPQCYQQAIVAIESPVITPVIAILSTEELGRSKRWFTSINRDSSTRPCHTLLILLSPDQELFDSLAICTVQNFAASEAFKITKSFPTVLAGSSLPRERCENKSKKVYRAF